MDDRNKPKDPEDRAYDRAYAEGVAASDDGDDRDDNPYTPNTTGYSAWESGWLDGEDGSAEKYR